MWGGCGVDFGCVLGFLWPRWGWYNMDFWISCVRIVHGCVCFEFGWASLDVEVSAFGVVGCLDGLFFVGC